MADDFFNSSVWDLSSLVILATVVCRSRNKYRNTVGWDLSHLVSLSTVVLRSRNKNRNTVRAVVCNTVVLMD